MFALDFFLVGGTKRVFKKFSSTGMLWVCVGLFATLWNVAPQAPVSMGSSRQEYWSGLPFPPPGDLPDPGMNPHLHISWSAGGCFTTEPLGKPITNVFIEKESALYFSVFTGLPCSLSSINAFVAECSMALFPWICRMWEMGLNEASHTL